MRDEMEKLKKQVEQPISNKKKRPRKQYTKNIYCNANPDFCKINYQLSLWRKKYLSDM